MKARAGLSLLELTVAMAVMSIVAGIVLIGFGAEDSDYRRLHNAAVRLRSDMRYAQRRAVMEGQRIGVRFDTENNRYYVIVTGTHEVIRAVQLDVNLQSVNYPLNTISFLPRGTAIPGTIALRHGNLHQEITTTLGGGQVRIHNIREVS